MKKLLGILLGVLCVFISSGNVAANLIQNGDFESGPDHLIHWNINGNVTATTAGCFMSLQGMDGHYALFGSQVSSGESSLSQTFNVTGDYLTVSFNWAFNFLDFNPKENDTFVSLISNQDKGLSITMKDLSSGIWWGEFGIGLTSGYFSRTYSLAEYAGLDTVSFTLREADGCTGSFAGIDNVVATASAMPASPVPEPATMLLFGCGLIGMAIVGRKKIINHSA